METATPATKYEKFAALEGCRGLCALLVAVMHMGQLVPWHLAEAPIIANAYLYVDFFFVLSGFVITHAFEKRIRSLPDIASSAIRRFGRLWPLHAAVLGAVVIYECFKLLMSQFAISLSAHDPFALTPTPEGLIANLLLLQGLASLRGALAALFVCFAGSGALSLAAPVVFAALVYVFSFEAGAVSRFLASKPMARLGAWSYSIYLVHYMVVQAASILLTGSGRLLGIGYFGIAQLDGALSPSGPADRYVFDLVVLVYMGVLIRIASITYRYIATPWRRRFNAMAAPLVGAARPLDALDVGPN